MMPSDSSLERGARLCRRPASDRRACGAGPARRTILPILIGTLVVSLPLLGILSASDAVARQADRGSSVTTTSNQSDPAPYAPNRVVFRVREGFSGEQVAAHYGASVQASIPEIGLFLLRPAPGSGEQTLLRLLAADSRVEFVEVDYLLQTAEGRQASMAFSEGQRDWRDVEQQWGFERLGVGQAHRLATGQGVIVAILDTGVDLDHPSLAARLDLPGFEPGIIVAPGDDRRQWVDSNGDGLRDGALGHGTHVAGVVLGVALRSRVLPVRVLDSDGVGFAFAISRGLVASVERGAHVANLSFGMPIASMSVAAAVDYAVSAGLVVVAPAGNASAARVEFPASHAPVFAVAGTDREDRKASFSNYGSAVDIAAPAVGILSTHVDGEFATWSGTSMAAPFVSGIAALLYERLGPSRAQAVAAEVQRRLADGAQPLASLEVTYAGGLGAGRASALGSVTVDGKGTWGTFSTQE